jgi:hypothetical protein
MISCTCFCTLMSYKQPMLAKWQRINYPYQTAAHLQHRCSTFSMCAASVLPAHLQHIYSAFAACAAVQHSLVICSANAVCANYANELCSTFSARATLQHICSAYAACAAKQNICSACQLCKWALQCALHCSTFAGHMQHICSADFQTSNLDHIGRSRQWLFSCNKNGV